MKKSATNLTHVRTGAIIAAGLLAAGTLCAADSPTAGAYGTPGNSGSSGTAEQSGISHAAKTFIRDAAEANQAEIAMAEIAQQKAQNPEIKQLAQQIREDHQQANEKLQSIAQAHGVTLEQTPDWLQKRAQDKLQKLNGAEFDQQYAKDMLGDHAKDIPKFEKASQNLQETDVKQYAQDCLPKLRQHLQHAEQAARAVGVDQSTISSYTKKVPESAGGTSEKPEGNMGSQKSDKSQQP